MDHFKNSFYLYAALSPQGLISDIGGKIIKETNINPSSLINKNFSEIYLWEHNENVAENIRNAIIAAGQGKELELETTLQTDPAKISTIKAIFTPIIDKENNLKEIIFSGIDISEYVKEIDFHKKRSERFLFAAESAEVGLWFWNVNHEEIFTTPLCNKLYGLSPHELMTYQKFIETIHPEDLITVQDILQRSINDWSDFNIEYRLQTENGKMIWLSVHGKTFQEDIDSTVMMGSVRDITHRKLSDERLQKLYEVEKNAKNEVEEANLQKDHFLAIVSHELRSPLQTILGWTKILLTNQPDEEIRQRALETIENSAKLQAKLISDLVDSSKIISGTLDFTIRDLDLSELINSVYQSQKPLADEKNINLVLGRVDKLEVPGDNVRLQQAITNLVSNAIKFTPPNGAILMQLTEKDGKAVFCVTDSGPGVPPEDLPFIFKQYFQSKSSKNKSGMGLGLSIVKAIISKHGGQVTAHNNDNGIGCTFSVNLPIIRKRELNTPEVSPETEESDFPLKNLKILIVEDNEDSREVLEFYLSRLGAKIYSASSSQEGLSFLTSTHNPPNIIISDISMPEEDGYSFIKKVRSLPDKNDIPAIALTAFASSNDEKKVFEAGFQKYHTKPFEPDLLISDILEAVSK